MTLRINGCDGPVGAHVPSNNSVDPPNTPWDGFTWNDDSDIRYTATALTNGSAIEVSGGQDAPAYFLWDLPASTELAVRFYFRLEEVPGGSPAFFIVQRVGSARVLNLAVSSTRYLLATDSAGTIFTSNGQIELGIWYRIEVQLHQPPFSSAVIGVYEAHSNSQAVQLIVANPNLGSQPMLLVAFGKFGNPPLRAQFDSIAVDDASSDAIGPVPSAVLTYQLSKYYPVNSDTLVYGVDASASTGAVSLVQSSGTEAPVVTEAPGRFVIAPPTGHGAMEFVVSADSGGEIRSRTIRIPASQEAFRSPILTHQGGDPTDIQNWA